MMLPGTVVRLIHPSNSIDRVRFYDEVLMVEASYSVMEQSKFSRKTYNNRGC